MSERVVGALLVREGAYAAQVRVQPYPAPGARIEYRALFDGDVLSPVTLLLDAVQLAHTGRVPEGVQAFQVVCDV